MRARFQVLIAGLSAFASGCSEPSAPTFVRPPNAVDVVVDFCSSAPSWIAVKNQGYAWMAFPIYSGYATRYQLPVTPKVAIAYGFASQLMPGYSDVRVLYVTAAELASMNCGPVLGTNLVYAPVAGVLSTDRVSGNLGPGSGLLQLGQTRMTFISVPTGMQDLVVSRRPSNAFGVDKYIVRHDITAANRDTLPPLDFASAEAVAPVTVAVSAPGAFGFTSSTFISNRGVTTPLTGFAFFADTAHVTLLPASVLAPGDGFAVSVSSSTRYATRYFTNPVPQTIALGPTLATPTVTTIASSPSLLLRAQVPSQAEYPSLATATFSQGVDITRRLSVTMTAGYLGATPATWSLEVPDMTSVIHKDLLLAGGTTTSWTVEAWDARIQLYFSKFGAADGEVVRCATTSSSGSLTVCKSPLVLY